MVIHACDLRACCNVKDLSPGTALENMQDCLCKGRRDHLRGKVRREMTPDQVRRIRSSGYSIPLHILANELGVSRRMVQGVLVGRNYRSIQ